MNFKLFLILLLTAGSFGFAGGFVGGARGVPGPALASTPNAIRAQQIELVDPSGRVLANLHVSPEGGPEFLFYDKFGHKRVALQASGEGWPSLVFDDDQGRGRTGVGFAGTTPAVLLADGKRVRASLALDDDGPKIKFFDVDGAKIWSQP